MPVRSVNLLGTLECVPYISAVLQKLVQNTLLLRVRLNLSKSYIMTRNYFETFIVCWYLRLLVLLSSIF